MEKLVAIGSTIGILPSRLKWVIIPTLERFGVIDALKDNSGNIRKLEENVPSEDEILKITHEIWEKEASAKDVEKVSVQSLEQCSLMPRTYEEIQIELENEGFSQTDISLALELQEGFEILKKAKVDNQFLVFSPYVWGENASKILHYISRLDNESKNYIKEVLDRVAQNQALPLDAIKNFPNDLISAARKTGLLDICQVLTRRGVQKEFCFTPRMWGSLGSRVVPDIYDDVKLFLSCVSFGRHYSSISRIKYPIELVEALIQRGKVGPATAIGTDFILLEKHGIVEVKKDPHYIGRYNMYLVKDDVAKTALEILKHERVVGLERSHEINIDGLCQTGEFINPEQDKIRLGKLSLASTRAQERLIKVLRGEAL